MKRTYTIFVLIMLANPFRYEWCEWTRDDAGEPVLLAIRCEYLRTNKRLFFIEWNA